MQYCTEKLFTDLSRFFRDNKHMEQEVYREVVFSGDSEIRNRASALIVELTQ